MREGADPSSMSKNPPASQVAVSAMCSDHCHVSCRIHHWRMRGPIGVRCANLGDDRLSLLGFARGCASARERIVSERGGGRFTHYRTRSRS
jgi:hypothetical protein